MFINNHLIIDKHYCGPSESGNGGYSAGIVAANVPFAAQVTLRKPPPLDQPMRLIVDGETAQLMDGETLVAQAKANDFALDIPPAVGLEEAAKAAKNYYGFEHSPFPNCFVCGHRRKHGEGLKLEPGRVGKQLVATPWIPYSALSDNNGHVKTEFVWAALDCPGAWALIDEDQVVVLGRFAVKQAMPVKVEEPHVVMGWVIESEGRKTWTGTAIFDEKGKVCAYAKGTWIAIKYKKVSSQ